MVGVTRERNRGSDRRRARIPHLARVGIGTVLLLVLSAGVSQGQEVTVEAISWNSNVYLGQSFIFQIRVMNGLRIRQPDLDDIPNFDADDIPRRWLSSYTGENFDPSQINEGTHFFYRMIAHDTGVQTIPSVTVRVDGEEYQTDPVNVTVEPPPEQTDFKLTLDLAKEEVYVGEPITLHAVWYFRDDAAFYTANMPILRHPDISVIDRTPQNAGSRLFLRMPSGSSQVSGTYGSTIAEGRQYQTVTFEQVLIPQAEGTYEFPPATVQVWQSNRNRGFGGGSDWRSYDQTVVGSNRLSLQVRPLPNENQPSDFTGVIGEELEVETTLSQMQMHVGDPITLEIAVSGPPSVERASVPPLSAQEGLSERFAFGPGAVRTSVSDSTKTFRQTLRVKNEQVTSLPPMEFSYFNTVSGTYERVSSDEIPITVSTTDTPSSGGATSNPEEDPSLTVSSVRSSEEGILFNYTHELAVNKRSGFTALLASPAMLAVIAGSVGFLAIALIYRSRRQTALEAAGPPSAEVRSEEREPEDKANLDTARRLEEEIEALVSRSAPLEELFDAWKFYLATRLSLESRTLTNREVDRALTERACSEGLRNEVRTLFDREEALIYGGTTTTRENREIREEAERIRAVTATIESELSET